MDILDSNQRLFILAWPCQCIIKLVHDGARSRARVQKRLLSVAELTRVYSRDDYSTPGGYNGLYIYIKTNKHHWGAPPYTRLQFTLNCWPILVGPSQLVGGSYTAWILYNNSLYKNLRGSNPRRAKNVQLYQAHSTLRIWGTLELGLPNS